MQQNVSEKTCSRPAQNQLAMLLLNSEMVSLAMLIMCTVLRLYGVLAKPSETRHLRLHCMVMHMNNPYILEVILDSIYAVRDL